LHDDKVWTCKNYYYRFDLSLTRSLVQLLDGDMQVGVEIYGVLQVVKAAPGVSLGPKTLWHIMSTEEEEEEEEGDF